MEKYRSLGIKLTPQRLAILNFLKDNKSHPSAEDIYKVVSKKFSTMSFATVYNTLEALKKKDCIQELTIDPVKKRYDPDMSPHHHLICMQCNEIVDIFKDFRLNLTEQMANSYKLKGSHVEFYGICMPCQSNL
jgi:Fur family peroxide stress response transcriptional regulator